MFSRGKPCLRSRRISAALDSVAIASNEPPLLFLYPRWFSSATRHDHSASSINSQQAPPSVPLHSCHKCRLPSSHSARRWLSSAAPLSTSGIAQVQSNETKTDVSPAECLEKGFAQTSAPNHGAPVGGISTSTTKLKDGPIISTPRSKIHLSPISERGSSKPPIRKTITAIAEERQPRRRRKSAKVRAIHFGREMFVNLAKKLPPTERKKLRYGRYVVRYAKEQHHIRKPVHWTDLVNLLEKLEHDTRVWSKHVRHKVLDVPEETVALMAGMLEMEENIWHVRIRNGCRIRVLDPAESEGPYRKVIISGTKRVLELVESGILKAQLRQEKGDPLVEVQKPLVPIIPSMEALQCRGLPVPLIRGVWSKEYKGWRSKMNETLEPLAVDQIPKPSPFTIKKFAEYVEDVVKSDIPLPLKKGLYDHAQASHEEVVEKMLLELFYDEANQKFVSTGAANIALDYLCKHEFLSSARRVLAKCESVASADTYNILLQSAARRQDLNIFHYILLSMSRLHVQPNNKTWLAFLQCILSPHIKAKVLQHMDSKGLLNRSETVRGALQLTVHDSLSQHLQSGGNVSEFIEKLNQLYGQKWKSALIINQMLRQLLGNKDFSAMLQLAEISERQRLPIDAMTLKLMLTFFSADIQKALWFIFRYTDPQRDPFDARTLEKLFLIAFKNKSLNVCRVLWRYACTKGMVSYKMKTAVRRSVIQNCIAEGHNLINQTWQINSGKVIIGLELSQGHGIDLPGWIKALVPSGFEDNPVASLAGYRPAGPQRRRQLDLADAIIKRDVDAGLMYRFSEPLHLMLEAAAVLDKEWNNTPRPLLWFVQNAIRVPIRKRNYLQEERTRYVYI